MHDALLQQQNCLVRGMPAAEQHRMAAGTHPHYLPFILLGLWLSMTDVDIMPSTLVLAAMRPW
jgi:hypothetical protein